MSDVKATGSTSRRMWVFLVFCLGFFAGFLIALLIGDKGNVSSIKSIEKIAAVAHEPEATPPHAQAAEEPEEPAFDDTPKTVQRPEEHELVITKAMRDRLMTIDFLSLLQDAEIRRFRFDGETRGIKLTKIRTGSMYEKAGFLDGDIIEQINGMAIADLQHKAKQMKDELPAANHVEFLVRRDDKVVKLRVRVAQAIGH